jgi:hypothetical protein
MTLGTGVLFNKPRVVSNDFNLKATTSADLKAQFGWTHIRPGYWGWQAGLEISTQTLQYNVDGKRYAESTGRLRSTIYAAANYDLINFKNCGLLIFAGPLLHLNNNVVETDSGTVNFAGHDRYYNSAPVGAGFFGGAQLTVRLFHRVHFFMAASLQKGLIVDSKAVVGDRKQYSVLHYDESGGSFHIGLMFFPPPYILSVGDARKRVPPLD